jgi:hypothetical protein
MVSLLNCLPIKACSSSFGVIQDSLEAVYDFGHLKFIIGTPSDFLAACQPQVNVEKAVKRFSLKQSVQSHIGFDNYRQKCRFLG